MDHPRRIKTSCMWIIGSSRVNRWIALSADHWKCSAVKGASIQTQPVAIKLWPKAVTQLIHLNNEKTYLLRENHRLKRLTVSSNISQESLGSPFSWLTCPFPHIPKESCLWASIEHLNCSKLFGFNVAPSRLSLGSITRRQDSQLQILFPPCPNTVTNSYCLHHNDNDKRVLTVLETKTNMDPGKLHMNTNV